MSPFSVPLAYNTKTTQPPSQAWFLALSKILEEVLVVHSGKAKAKK